MPTNQTTASTLSGAMFSAKVLSLLATFNKVELNRFKKYLLSPYLNDQPDVIRLFDILDEMLRHSPEEIAGLTQKAVWGKLCPGKKLDGAALRRLSSDLNLLAQRFLVAEMKEKEPFHEWLHLQKALEKPHLEKHLSVLERKMKQYFEEIEVQSAEGFLDQFKMHHQMFSRASKVVVTMRYGDTLASADFYLDCFYFIQKLRYYVAWLQFSGIRETEKSITIPEGFWAEMEMEKYKSIPLIQIYRLAIFCFTEPEDEGHFHNFLLNLEQNASRLPDVDLRECYQIAQNYCALKVNQGKTDYYSIFFRVLKKVAQLGILVINNQVSEGVFKNMVTISMWVGEFNWAENFVHEYADFLPVEIRENAKKYSLSNIYFRQKKHAQVIELLQNVQYNDVVYALGSKLILLRTYYEINETLALESLIDSFRIYIRRNKELSKNQKREYNNFLNFVKKLTAINPHDTKAISKFRELVMRSSSNMPKKWMLEKIDELGKKH